MVEEYFVAVQSAVAERTHIEDCSLEELEHVVDIVVGFRVDKQIVDID